MDTTAGSLTAGRGPLRTLLKPGNVAPALVWLFLLVNQARLSSFPPSPSTVLLIVIYTHVVLLFMLRRDAMRVGNSFEGLVALGGTFAVSFLKGPDLRDTQLIPSLIQVAALLGWAWALFTLGRSFGVVPADRGLVSHGPYRLVRHPIYAFEALFFATYFYLSPNLYNAVILIVANMLQVIRILREEMIIEGYNEYTTRVRWRILPGIW